MKQVTTYRKDNFTWIESETDIGIKPPKPTVPPANPTVPPANPTVSPANPLTDLNKNTTKNLLLRPELLQNDFQTSSYCLELIKQVNWVYEYKKSFKEIIVIALRNLLENHLDFTYSEAYPHGNKTKFDDKLKEMLSIVRSTDKTLKTDFVNKFDSWFNQSYRGYQTQNNLYNSQFTEQAIEGLLGVLHLSAHKGSNIVTLDMFVNQYGKSLNILLEVLSCTAIYYKSAKSIP